MATADPAPPPPTPPPHTLKSRSPARAPLRWIIHIAMVLVVLGAVIAAFIYWESRGSSPAKALPSLPADPIPVSVAIVRPQDVPLAPVYLGRTEASQLVELRARVNGFLLEVAFDEGKPVEQGQLLFRIDPRPFEAHVNEVRAALASAEARLSQTRRQLERARTAAQGGAVSQTELDQWLTEEEVALADVELQRARVATAELDLSYTTIISPISGIIGETAQDVGSYVQAGAQSLLATVQQTDPLYVNFSVSEQELRSWQEMTASGEVTVPPEDQIRLSVHLVDGSTYAHEGRLDFVGASLAPTTGTANVRGIIPNPDGILRPGQFVRVTALGIQRHNAILIPQRAIMQSPGGASVYIVDDAGTAQLRTVTLGEWTGQDWIIRSGLAPGDRVIVDHMMKVRPGVRINPTPVPAPAPSEPLPAPAPAATEGGR